MELVGKYLKSIRINKKYSIQFISSELKVGENLIRSIESDDFPDYLASVFLIGHIRSYAKYLNIDEDLIIENFKIQTSYNNQGLNETISKPVGTKHSTFFPKYISIVSTVVIASSFYFLFIQPNNIDPEYAITPDLPENLNLEIEAIEMNLAMSNKLKATSDINIVSNDESNILKKNQVSDLTSSSSVIASSANNSSEDLFNNITLKFSNSTWIQLRDPNNNIIFSKLMDQGDEYSYSSSKNYNITAGNAGNIIIFLDGVVKGKAGKAGEVIDALIIDNNFTN